jgi:Holliday junction DNA helicase RuvA
MIAYIKGRVIKRSGNSVVVETGGLGYKVFVGEGAAAELAIGAAVELWTHHHVREDASELYGFPSADKLEMFDLLLNVNGIGPKSAMGVMAAIGVEDLKTAIATSDLAMLTKVSGIGKKTAERMILDLKDKIGFLSPVLGESSAVRGEEVEALVALGYSLQEAREALSKVGKDIKESGARIKEALKNIRK